MKNLKKMTAIILCVVLFILSITPALASEETTNYNILLNHGYPKEFLDNLSDSYMSKLVEEIGSGTVDDIQIVEKSLVESELQTRGIDPSSMTLQVASGAIYDANNKVTSVLVSVYWEWAANKPIYRGVDALSFNWDSGVFVYSGGFYAQDVYKSNANDDWTLLKETSNPDEATQGGIGYMTDLEEFKTYVGGSMLIVLYPKTDGNGNMYKGTAHSTALNVKYAHAPVPLTGLSLTVGPAGVGFSWTISCDTTSATSVFRYSR